MRTKSEPSSEGASEVKKLKRQLAALKLKYKLLQKSHDKLLDDSMTDVLTSFPNRRALFAYLDKGCARINRLYRDCTEQPTERLCIAMLDIDDFKSVNDTHGHSVGDDMLRRFGELVTAAGFRETDFVGRYGGEEFMVVMPQTDESGARKKIELLRLYIEKNLKVQAASTLVIRTISAGVAEYLPDTGRAQIIVQSDNALYEAKRRGKNRVVCASELA